MISRKRKYNYYCISYVNKTATNYRSCVWLKLLASNCHANSCECDFQCQKKQWNVHLFNLLCVYMAHLRYPANIFAFSWLVIYIYIYALLYTSSLFINFAKKQHQLTYGYLRYMTWTKVFIVQCRPGAGAQPSCSWKDISMRGHASWCNAEVSIPRWRERIDAIHFRGIQHESKFWDIPKLLIY
jgi:hypothetical protein